MVLSYRTFASEGHISSLLFYGIRRPVPPRDGAPEANLEYPKGQQSCENCLGMDIRITLFFANILTVRNKASVIFLSQY
jgi:hypothetical protein